MIKRFLSPRPPIYYGYIIIAAIFIIQLLAFFIYDSFGAFVDPWIKSLDWSKALISGAYSTSFLLMGLMGIVMGILTDKFSPRLALSICAVCLGEGLVLVSRMQDPWQFYLGYGVLFGTGMSGVWSPLLSLIPRWFARNSGLMTGLVISGGGLGAFLGPPLITRLIEIHSWNTAVLVLGVVILAVVLLAAQALKRNPQQPYTGLAEEKPAGPDLRLQPMEFSLKQAVATTQFWTIFAVFFCLAFYTFSVLVHLMSHSLNLGISSGNAAFILACISGASLVGNFVMGRYGDKVGPQKILIISLVTMTVSLIWLVTASEMWMLYLFSMVFGFNHGGNATAQAPLVARIFGTKALGSILGAAVFGFTLGGASGPLVTGYIFDVTRSYQWAFVVCAVVGIFGSILIVVLKPSRHSPDVT